MKVSPDVDGLLRGIGERLASQSYGVERRLLRARDLYARSYVRATVLANRVRYDAPIDPYRLIEVDPHDIEHVVGRRQPMFRDAGQVVAGNWDQTDLRFEEMDVYRAYRRHFEEGVPWSETDFFERVVGEMAEGRERWGCHTRAEFEARCERLDDLYERIAEEGYCSQAELLETDEASPIRDPDRLKTERYKDEIAVHVGRDGDLLFVDGRNRLSIAKLLDLDEIRVRVLRRHTEWQAVRDAYVRGDLPREEHEPHPDLDPLVYAGR
ncbi:hypothetical protein [Halobacterium wangiae]|uniref:hypothetical protein n=1 Tax=Halobacterium wangiae TaxID=2902623 RepID=UPI001E5670E3|nr:hypothetical protein [Halobacterium wangiae]